MVRDADGALDDGALVVAAQSGDRSALDQLMRRHYDKIHAVCRRVTGSGADADDACQEALIKITRGIAQFDGRSAFGTWAYRIATNASLDELRKRKRRPRLHTAQADGSNERDVVDPVADRRVEAIADRLALDRALGELSEEFRAAVVLRDVADLDYAEIAEALSIPIGTVKSRIARGRSMVAERLRLDSLLTGSTQPEPLESTGTAIDDETLDSLIARDELGLVDDAASDTEESDTSPGKSRDSGNRSGRRRRPRKST